MNDIKQWLQTNIILNGKPIPKRCKKGWFVKNGYVDKWNEILAATSFLDDSDHIVLSQRIWHIINEQPRIKCGNPACNNVPVFSFYAMGYRVGCCCSCAQLSPSTIDKIKKTNLQRYGSEYGLQNESVKKKRVATVKTKYGVDNISKLPQISAKKKATCMRNYGTEWFLERQDLKQQAVFAKYGVDNVLQVKEVADKMGQTRMDDYYDSLILDKDRFRDKVTVAFSKEDYQGVCKVYPFTCSICKNTFNSILRYERVPRCPTCYPIKGGTSLFEKEILVYVKSLLPPTEEVRENDRKTLLNGKELDIYIPSRNVAIECNGLYWHGEYVGGKDKNYHISKSTDCASAGIRLIHIFEDEWYNKSTIIKAKIAYILKIGDVRKIYARECKIRSLHTKEKKYFLEANHIQGNDVSSIQYGLFYQNQLVAAMTFCKNRVFMNPKYRTENEFEMSRYASLLGYSVIGGAGKLMAHFIKEHKPGKIVSYADRRYTVSPGNLYEKLGFTKVNEGTPNYWYFGTQENYKRFHRFGFAKHTLAKRLKVYDPNKTEWQNMKNNNWDRIWDCGNFRYEMIIIPPV